MYRNDGKEDEHYVFTIFGAEVCSCQSRSWPQPVALSAWSRGGGD